MQLKKFVVVCLCISFCLSFSYAHAQVNFSTEVKKRYLDVDQEVWLGCSYFRAGSYKVITANGPTYWEGRKLVRDFSITSSGQELSMQLEVAPVAEEEARYLVSFSSGHRVSGEITKVKERSFYLPFTNDFEFNRQHEVNKIYCTINLAKERPFVLDQARYHFAVHPHNRYDYMNYTTDGVINYLEDKSYKSLTLLEQGNYRGNLVELSDVFARKRIHLPENYYPSNLVEVPESTSLVVSAAGHNDFSFKAQGDVAVVYTGGNHNYCIWNNARNLLKSYFNSPAQGTLDIIYDTNSIVAQRKGIIRGLSFPLRAHRQSNRLKDLFSDRSTAKKYHEYYFKYFKENIDELYSGLYSEIELTYDARSHYERVVLKGTGDYKLKVNFIYRY